MFINELRISILVLLIEHLFSVTRLIRMDHCLRAKIVIKEKSSPLTK